MANFGLKSRSDSKVWAVELECRVHPWWLLLQGELTFSDLTLSDPGQHLPSDCNTDHYEKQKGDSSLCPTLQGPTAQIRNFRPQKFFQNPSGAALESQVPSILVSLSVVLTLSH